MNIRGADAPGSGAAARRRQPALSLLARPGTPAGVTWVLFDLNGTLVDPAGIGEPLMPAAFADAIQLAMVTTMTGGTAGFRDLIGAGLRRRLELAGRDVAEAGPVLERLAAMPAYPEARAALDRLAGAGARLGVLTQSGADAAEALLRNAGLRDALEVVISADDAGAFKPDPRVYRLALDRVGPAWLVAAHWWDVAGAARAGLRTAWVSRHDGVYPDAAPTPDVTGADLLEAAEGVLAAG
jgi:2-haloacid dehalogenase